jgi:hypothetical protein
VSGKKEQNDTLHSSPSDVDMTGHQHLPPMQLAATSMPASTAHTFPTNSKHKMNTKVLCRLRLMYKPHRDTATLLCTTGSCNAQLTKQERWAQQLCDVPSTNAGHNMLMV